MSYVQFGSIESKLVGLGQIKRSLDLHISPLGKRLYEGSKLAVPLQEAIECKRLVDELIRNSRDVHNMGQEFEKIYLVEQRQ